MVVRAGSHDLVEIKLNNLQHFYMPYFMTKICWSRLAPVGTVGRERSQRMPLLQKFGLSFCVLLTLDQKLANSIGTDLRLQLSPLVDREELLTLGHSSLTIRR